MLRRVPEQGCSIMYGVKLLHSPLGFRLPQKKNLMFGRGILFRRRQIPAAEGMTVSVLGWGGRSWQCNVVFTKITYNSVLDI